MHKISTFIKNPTFLILSLLKKIGTWLPDKLFLQLRFYLEMGQILNLKNPKTFQEKIQWLKLYNRKPEYTKLVDKYAVKDYVEGKLGDQYIIQTLGVWDRVEDIDFDSLPEKFVLKSTHGGGGGGVIICRNKSKLDINETKNKLKNSLKSDIYKFYREWPYNNVPRRIIAEQLLEIPKRDDLIDYKVYCFNGKPTYIQVIQDRNTKETIDFFDTEWNHLEFVEFNKVVKSAKITPSRPINLDDMLEVAKKLSQDIPFVRVDLYNIDSKVYSGELTYYISSELGKFTPEEWSTKLDELLLLNDNKQFIVERGGEFIVYLDQNIIEKLDDDIRDYKFFCFNGESKFLKVDFGRFSEHHANYYDLNWNILPFGEAAYPPIFDKKIAKPVNFDKMIEIAKKLSEGQPFIRVDLYNILGKIYFGELTFYPASGMGTFLPEKYDKIVGDMILLPKQILK